MFDYLSNISSGVDPSGGRYTTISDVIIVIANLFIGLAIGVSIIGMLVAGIKFVTSKGDYKAVASAKQGLTYAVIGAVLATTMFAVRSLALRAVGFKDIPELQTLPGLDL